MPVISGGGGNTTAQVVASGKVVPVAAPAGATVDTTTYDNLATGIGKMSVLVFPADTAFLGIAITGDAFPRWFWAADPADGFYFGNGASNPVASGVGFSRSGSNISFQGGLLADTAGVRIPAAAAATNYAPQLGQVSPIADITSGALPTVQLVTATGAQISTTRDAETTTPCTFNPGAATTATVTVALSPDNVTYSTLGVQTVPAGVALDGTIHLVKVRVPAGWYLKLTVNAQATLGLTTYY